MTDMFTLAEDPEREGPDEELLALFGEDDSAAAPTPVRSDAPSAWRPGQAQVSFAAPVSRPSGSKQVPPRPAKRKGKPSVEDELGYKPLPEPKVKRVTPREQAKLDKIQLAKEREADAAAMRINGVDGDGIEIPKKPWLTFFSGKRAKSEEVAETLTDLASMLESGESEHQAIDALAEQYLQYDIGQAYERVGLLLDRGVTLSDSMAEQTDNFPPVVRELISASKIPQDMHRNLRQAAVLILEADNVKSQVKSALFKPGLMVVFLAIFTIAAVQWLLPMTASMFTDIGAKVPPSTTIILSVGAVLKWVIGALLVLAILGQLMWKVVLKNNERVEILMDTVAIKAPLVGDIMRMSVAARFCDVLAACLSVQMSELESLSVAGRAAGNRALQAWIEDHVGRQSAGVVSFADVSKTEMLPWNLRNRLETTTSITRRIEILKELGGTFHNKARDRLQRFAERVGPISEGIVIGTVIGVVMLIVSPIMTFIPTMINSFGAQ